MNKGKGRSPDWEKGLKNLLTVNLGLKPDDRLLILTDLPPIPSPPIWEKRVQLAKTAQQVAEELGTPSTFFPYPALAGHGMEPPRQVWEEAFGPEAVENLAGRGILTPLLEKRLDDASVKILSLRPRYTAVLALTNFSTSHTRFRKLMTDGESRYASCPLFEPEMLGGPMAIDWRRLAAATRRLADALSSARMARVECPLGTRLEMSLEGRMGISDDGLLTTPAAFGNLPAGEAYIAPREESVEGVLVITCLASVELDRPLRVVIREGKAGRIEGRGRPRETLEQLLSNHPGNRQVAELGVGTNPGATNPRNVLEAEKIAGTIHVAFGDNQGFGGKNSAPFHQDFVVFNPRLILDGRQILPTAPAPEDPPRP